MMFNEKIYQKNLSSTENLQINKEIVHNNDYEKEIFNMCSEILETNNFNVKTDLFQLGLTSLSVLKLVNKISKKFGVVVSVTNIMRAKTVQGIIKEISSSTITEEKISKKQRLYPLTQNQLGVYFDCVKNPGKLIYNLPKCFQFDKDIDPNKLKIAILEVINKNPYIKTRLVNENGQIYLERRDDLDVDIKIHEGVVDIEVKNNFIKPFSLFDGPLFRFEIYRNSIGTYFLSDFHHIIMDGTSLNIFYHEIATIYDGGDVDDKDYNGFDYSLEELAIEKSQIYADAESYFDEKIKNFDGSTILSPDLNGKEEDGRLGETDILIDKLLVEKYCKDNAITPNNLFLAATVFTLSKFVYNKNILISTISNGRSNPHFQKSLAMMVKTLPIALKINSDMKACEYFDYVENIWLDILKYESYPFTKISEKYDIFPELLYAYQGNIVEDIKIDGNYVKREELVYDALKFKLFIGILETGKDFKIFTQYNDAIYSETLIKNVLTTIKIVLNKFMENPKVQLKDISLLSEDEIEEGFKIKPVKDQLINKIFENQVEENKDKIALITEDGEFTYDELNRKSNRIANALIKRGVNVEDRIMFILNRDSRLIATMLGIIKAGCAFIPVDPEYPRERIEHVLKDSNSRYVITKEDMPNALDIDELLKEENEENPVTNLTAENLCYLIYTSGSTGRPKGVMITHGNISNYVCPDPENSYVHGFIDKASKMLSITTVSFDLFINEAFIPLMNGLTLIFANEEESKNPFELVKLFEQTNCDSFSATPSRMIQYLEFDGIAEALAKCNVIFAGGEKYPLQLHKMLKNCTAADIYNAYGPTEITISCNTKHLTDNDITVGKPLLNVIESVMDQDCNPLPPGIVGELFVGGAGVSRGYWNREKLNNEQFVMVEDIRYYKTGDFARKEINGEISILGRLDNQIKLRGLRIEIGEIENVISEYSNIKSVTVIVRKYQDDDHLCAYFTADTEIIVDDS